MYIIYIYIILYIYIYVFYIYIYIIYICILYMYTLYIICIHKGFTVLRFWGPLTIKTGFYNTLIYIVPGYMFIAKGQDAMLLASHSFHTTPL